MGNDDQLRTHTQIVKRIEQPCQIDVIKGGLDFIQYVKRARTCSKDGKQERQGGQGTFPSGQQCQLFDPFACRTCLNYYPGSQEVFRIIKP